MTRAINQTEPTNEIMSLLLKKKNRAEKLLDITLEQQALLDQGYTGEFLTLMQLRQEIIDEIEKINQLLHSYSGINNLTLDILKSPSSCINNTASTNYYQSEKSHIISGILNQINETNAEINKIYLQVHELEIINKKKLYQQFDILKKELSLMQNSKARQILYDQLPAQYNGAFLDSKK